MKCPLCQEETSPGKVCERCGKALPPQKDVEVEYREFTVSELLDIRMVKRNGVAVAGGKSEKKGPLPRDVQKTVNDSRTQAEPPRKTFLTVIITVLIVVLAVIGGLYFFGFFAGF